MLLTTDSNLSALISSSTDSLSSMGGLHGNDMKSFILIVSVWRYLEFAGKGKGNEFSMLCHPFHSGAINGVDVCYRKPIGKNDLMLYDYGSDTRTLYRSSRDLWSGQDDPRVELSHPGNGDQQGIRGIHFVSSTSSNRPKLTSRYNYGVLKF